VVAVDRAGITRLDPIRRLAVDLPPLLLVLTPIALLNVLVGIRRGGSPAPSEVEAVLGADAVGPGRLAELGFHLQLAVVQATASVLWDSGLLQAGRGLSLITGSLAALLLWPVLRRLDLGANAVATAMIIAGLGPLALRLQPTVDPGALAACWIAVAAAARYRVPPTPGRTRLAAALLVAAVLTAPVAGVGLLAMTGYALITGRVGTRLPPRVGVGLAVVAALGAAGGAVWLLPSVTGATSGIPWPALVALIGPGLLAVGRSWNRRPELRPVAVLVGVWLCCAIAPGPARHTALLLAVPPLALLVGALLTDSAAELLPRFSIAAATAVTVALVSGVVTGLWPLPPPGPGSYQQLARWLTVELDARVVLSAAPLERAELIAAGVPADRFAPDSVPAGAVTVVPSEAGCGDIGSPVLQMSSASGPLSVCAPPVPASDPVLTPGAGPLLVQSSGIPMAEPARRLLLEDRVDSRLVTVLAGAATSHAVEIDGFPPVSGESTAGPRRVAVLGGVVPVFDVDGRPAASALELFLNAQPPPYRPDVRALPDGRLVVHFRLPTPTAQG
jgi:hypothetical protein